MSRLISYTRRASEEQIAELNLNVADKGERSPPAVFAGRQDFIEGIDLRVSTESKLVSSDNSFVIQGAPGAGKTSLLLHLEALYAGVKGILPVYLEGTEMNNPVEFATKIVHAAGKDVVKTLGQDESRTHQSSIGLVELAKQQESWSSHRASVMDQLEKGASLWSVLSSSKQIPDIDVLLVLVDEAQTVTGFDSAGNNAIAMTLNSGNTGRFKTVCVFAGLSDTSTVLADVGVSRTTRGVIRLGSLDAEESEQVADGFFKEHRLDSLFSEDNCKAIRDSLVLASEGWPRHLHHYLQGLVLQVVKDHAHGSPYFDLDSVLDHGHKARFNYCTDRLLNVKRNEFRIAISNIAKDYPADRLIDYDKIVACSADLGLSITETETGLREAIHSGVLERAQGSVHAYYQFPIPSFHTFMICEGVEDIAVSELREATNRKIEHLFP